MPAAEYHQRTSELPVFEAVFRHAQRFGDTTEFLGWDGKDIWIVRADGTGYRTPFYTLNGCRL